MSAALRVKPRVRIGLAIWVGYVVLIFFVQKAGGVPYTDLGDSGDNLFFGVGISLIVATVLLALTTTLLGWWRPALFDASRSRYRWPIIAPIAMALLAVVNLAITDWSSFDAPFLAALLVLLLVGFTEEMTNRGLLLVALRSRLSEVWVWLFTSVAFALMHSINALAGQSISATLNQVILTFFGGTIFYILRRTTGSLIWAMVLHGGWDFAAFSSGHGDASSIGLFVNVLYFMVCAFAIVAVWWTFASAAPGPRGVAFG